MSPSECPPSERSRGVDSTMTPTGHTNSRASSSAPGEIPTVVHFRRLFGIEFAELEQKERYA